MTARTGDARSRTGPALHATMARLRPKNGRHEFPLSHPCMGEVGRDSDELPGDRDPGKQAYVGRRHGAPT